MSLWPHFWRTLYIRVPTRLEHELLFHSLFVCKSSTHLGVQFATETKTLCGIKDTSTFFHISVAK